MVDVFSLIGTGISMPWTADESVEKLATYAKLSVMDLGFSW